MGSPTVTGSRDLLPDVSLPEIVGSVARGMNLVVFDGLRLLERAIWRVDHALQVRIATQMAQSDFRASVVEQRTLTAVERGEVVKGVDPGDLLQRWNKEHAG